MCIAIVTKPGASVSNEHLFKWWNGNQDGGGFAYVGADNKVKVEKGFLKYNPFQLAYRKAADEFAATSPFLIHMRIGTSGHKEEKNTHPFYFTPQAGPAGAMIHNGVLFTPAGDRAGPREDRKSDTRVLVEAFNNILRLEDVKAARIAMGLAIGGGNKLAFLYDNREYVIINEDRGEWHDNVWYSNNFCNVFPYGKR